MLIAPFLLLICLSVRVPIIPQLVGHFSRDVLDDNQRSPEDIAALGEQLLNGELSLDDKRGSLAILAHAGTVEAYRILKEYVEQADKELEEWAVLALQECQLFLEADLESATGMIMGGLGGDRNRIRCFFAACLQEDRMATEAEQTVVKVSFGDVSERLNAKMGILVFEKGYVSMEVLIPLDVAVAEFAESGIDAVNEVTDLLIPYYYVSSDRASGKDLREWVEEVRR